MAALPAAAGRRRPPQRGDLGLRGVVFAVPDAGDERERRAAGLLLEQDGPVAVPARRGSARESANRSAIRPATGNGTGTAGPGG